MKKAVLQRKGKALVPTSKEHLDTIMAFPENEFLNVSIKGHRRPRSVQQNKWIHAIFRQVAYNTDDPEWNTPEKAKRNVKLSMKFFKDDVVVQGNKVFFELRSFAFDQMDQHEADRVYDQAKQICADFLGVSVETLETEAKRD